jgi:hypothetical protein
MTVEGHRSNDTSREKTIHIIEQKITSKTFDLRPLSLDNFL